MGNFAKEKNIEKPIEIVSLWVVSVNLIKQIGDYLAILYRLSTRFNIDVMVEKKIAFRWNNTRSFIINSRESRHNYGRIVNFSVDEGMKSNK